MHMHMHMHLYMHMYRVSAYLLGLGASNELDFVVAFSCALH